MNVNTLNHRAIDPGETTMPQIQSLDLIVPEAWEGPSGEIHVNVISAATSSYGAPIVSGITSMILAVAELLDDGGAAPPAELTWSFDDALLTSERFSVDVSGDIADAAGMAFAVRVGERRIGQGTMRFGALDLADELHQPPTALSPGRTLLDGDRELYDWWLSRSCPQASPAPSGVVPWPMLVSLAGGLISKVEFVGIDHDDLLNRAMVWRFHRPVALGDTLRCHITTTTERISKSRPDMGVWTGAVLLVSQRDDDVVATVQWTLMFTAA